MTTTTTTISTTVFRPGATALISGGANGVGFAFARICRAHGMHVALLDRDSDALRDAVTALLEVSTSEKVAQGKAPSDIRVEGYTLDVSDLSAWRDLRGDIERELGGVDLLVLNAGHAPKPSSEKGSAWEDEIYFANTMATNFFGVTNGINSFLPLVRKSTGPSAVVITGSKQGITNPPGNPAYNASKAAVKAVAEHLAHDLRTEGKKCYAPHVSVHLLVPGWTFTGLSGHPGVKANKEVVLQKKPKGAWLPGETADYGVRGIKEGRFYLVCPDNDVDEALDQARMTWAMGDVVEGRAALSRWSEMWKGDAAAWIEEEAKKRREGGGL